MNYTSFWKKLWSLKIPGKILNFLWRVCRGCLPTLAALVSKHVNVDKKCPWCFSELETELHVLFDCDFSKTVWTLTGLQNCVIRLQNESCLDFFARIFLAAVHDQCAMIGIVCWSLWNRRNKWVWDHANGSAFGVHAAARTLLAD